MYTKWLCETLEEVRMADCLIRYLSESFVVQMNAATDVTYVGDGSFGFISAIICDKRERSALCLVRTTSSRP